MRRRPDVCSLDYTQSPEKEKTPGKMEVIYGNEIDVTHAFLKNGARVNVDVLKQPKFYSSENVQTMGVGERMDDSPGMQDETIVDREEEQTERMKNQLEGYDVDGALVDVYTRIFMQFGDQVGMVRKGDKGVGLDPRKIGNRLDLKDTPVFIIAGSREAELRAVVKNPPAGGVGEVSPKFRVRPTCDYLVEPGNSEERLGMVIYYESADGKESRKMVFFFAKEHSTSEEKTEPVDGESGVENNLDEAA